MTRAAIEVEGLSYAYFEGGPDRVKDLSFSIEEGSLVGIIGQNGAGKSTLMKNITGLLPPSRGTIRVLGEDSRDLSLSQMSSRVGYVLQNADRQLFADTVRQELAFGPKNQGIDEAEIAERTQKILKEIGILHLIDDYPLALSKGDRAKVVIASTLMMNPSIIILDEPTGGQDFLGRYQIMEIAKRYREQGHTVLVVTHSMSLVAEYCDRVLVLCQGSILMDGSARQVFSQPEILKKTYVRPPQITELARRLAGPLGQTEALLRVEEVGQLILKRLDEKKK